jgi:hypothetical protein
MAFVAEVDSKFVGMFFRLRRVVQSARNGGFKYMGSSGGAMAPTPKPVEARA